MAILSIQSSVALGHVGNAAAVLPLQRLGHEVWPIDTVRLSNHPGHGAWRGRVADAAEVADLVRGIDERGALAGCGAVLSGYLGSAAMGLAVLDAVARVRAANPKAVYCCDPVIGDQDEGVYVGDGVARFMVDHAVPAADLVVPNAFELGRLTGCAVDDAPGARAAAEAVLERGPGLVVVTSVPAGGDGAIANLAVSRSGAWAVETPRLELRAKGAGDVFAALLLGAWLADGDPRRGLEDASAQIFALVEATADADELALVEAQDAWTAPQHRFAARRLD